MTEGLATTPAPPYVAVIFSSIASSDRSGYAEMAVVMDELAARQPGYLGIESARTVEGVPVGITVSYWADEESARQWKQVGAHLGAQRLGRARWYRDYVVRIATVTREYQLGSSDLDGPALD